MYILIQWTLGFYPVNIKLEHVLFSFYINSDAKRSSANINSKSHTLYVKEQVTHKPQFGHSWHRMYTLTLIAWDTLRLLRSSISTIKNLFCLNYSIQNNYQNRPTQMMDLPAENTTLQPGTKTHKKCNTFPLYVAYLRLQKPNQNPEGLLLCWPQYRYGLSSFSLRFFLHL